MASVHFANFVAPSTPGDIEFNNGVPIDLNFVNNANPLNVGVTLPNPTNVGVTLPNPITVGVTLPNPTNVGVTLPDPVNAKVTVDPIYAVVGIDPVTGKRYPIDIIADATVTIADTVIHQENRLTVNLFGLPFLPLFSLVTRGDITIKKV